MSKTEQKLWTSPVPEPNPEWLRDESPPVVWVEQLRVLRSLNLSDEALVRQIRLHRGLNILWAEPPAADQTTVDKEAAKAGNSKGANAKNKLHGVSVAGHSAGKTTFTRFIRFLLGELTFGDEQLMADVRDAFPDGYVSGCVHVDHQTWFVARPFAKDGDSFAVRGDQWQDLLCESGRMAYSEFENAIESAVFTGLSNRTFPSGSGKAGWKHLLPWLTRDQDCHFGNLARWRCSESQSQCVPLPLSDRHYLVETFLGLLSKQELDLGRANVQRRKKIGKMKESLGKLEHQERVDTARLTDSFGNVLPDFEDGLFDNAVDLEIEKRHPLPLDPNADEDFIESLQDELQGLIEQFAEKKSESDAAATEQQREEDLYRVLAGTANEEETQRWAASGGPSIGFCPVPIVEARENGCTACQDKLASFDQARLEKDLDAAVANQESVAEEAAKYATQLRLALKPFERSIKTLRGRLRTARRRENDFIRESSKAESTVSSLKSQASLAKQSWEQAESIREQIKTLKTAILSANREIKQLRQGKNERLIRLETIYDYCVSALLGSDVHGKATLKGNRLELRLLYRGELRGSAMKLVRSIALDIASVLASVDGTAKHPRFLIHDGPRDSDLTSQLYQRIFMLAQAMEGERKNGHEPPFQYIITTTEPPPPDMQKKPWLLEPVLDATVPSKRLLGVDL